MTSGSMRDPKAALRFRHIHSIDRISGASGVRCVRHDAFKLQTLIAASVPTRRYLASIRDDSSPLSEVWFNSSFPRSSLAHEYLTNLHFGVRDGERNRPPDERTLKLGKTIRILHDRLPTLLASPLPTEILSPHISLHLFPSTHPHLPKVSGRIAYNAALWTAPVAWGRVPVVGNVRLVILSERMVKGSGGGTALDESLRNEPQGSGSGSTNGDSNGTGNGTKDTYDTKGNDRAKPGSERLIVKWKTCASSSGLRIPAALETLKGYAFSESGANSPFAPMTPLKGNRKDGKDDAEFSGLFIFAFDEKGRIVTHTIEHAQQGGDWEKMTRVVNVTDWLLGRAKGRREEPELALGFCEGGRKYQGRRRGQE